MDQAVTFRHDDDPLLSVCLDCGDAECKKHEVWDLIKQCMDAYKRTGVRQQQEAGLRTLFGGELTNCMERARRNNRSML